ncbi:UNKNOWN [Stylonychia lemnae]|uniref:Transmembrane protein n=1 Tax=Stylonychia lemnae TaxID=5949 RepID=A0A078BBP5_STYLE|nr:UNKNOWN [Stylonychia lemnae]|eukprot:CDW90998.1 UNKNOWN [Stylonychia lemnae]
MSFTKVSQEMSSTRDSIFFQIDQISKQDNDFNSNQMSILKTLIQTNSENISLSDLNIIKEKFITKYVANLKGQSSTKAATDLSFILQLIDNSYDQNKIESKITFFEDYSFINHQSMSDSEKYYSQKPRWIKWLTTFIYLANVAVAGYICVLSLFAQELSQKYVFDNAGQPGETMYITGCHWTAITIISIFGLVFSRVNFSIVFLHQFIYKGLYLIVSVIPSLINKEYEEIPIGMSIFFLVWEFLLPIVIPWGYLFGFNSKIVNQKNNQ